jgi:hypothetical protein
MGVSGHTVHLSSKTAPLLPSIRARIPRGNARVRKRKGNDDGCASNYQNDYGAGMFTRPCAFCNLAAI